MSRDAALTALLAELGLEQYGQLFEDHEVDLATLAILTDADLKELGLSFGPRKRLLNAMAVQRVGSEPVAQSSPTNTGDSERRQLTVLFCDMVGFTDIASRVDPEVLQRVIRAYEDLCAACITRYEGYVFQRLGDGIVAFFGFPLAHEGEAERAILASLDILERMAHTEFPDVGALQVRIGIATGVVVVSASERSAVGETMNLAARLQAIAEPGNVVVSEKVHRIAGGAFRYQDLGQKSLKGIARSSHAYRILGARDVLSRFDAATQDGMTPLIGRERELGELLDHFHGVQQGRGHLAILAGEAGIGKSRMLQALRERIDAVGAATMHYQCSPFHTHSALHPSAEALRRTLRFARDESVDAQLDKLESLVVAHYGQTRTDARLLADVLSLPTEARYGPLGLSARRHKDEIMRALLDLTEAAMRGAPSLLIFEDVHWADPSSLELLDVLLRRLPTLPLLVVITHRPEFVPHWPLSDLVSAIELSRLNRDQSREIIDRVTDGKRLPSRLVEEIINKADGVPLFVEEVTKSVLESGDLAEEADRYVYTGSSASMTLPATLRDSLMARLDRVPAVKEIAQIGATIGRDFSYELLAAVSPMPRAALEEGLTRLINSGLAFARGRIPDAIYTFKHALVGDAAYDSLLKSRRQELHDAIAGLIESRFPDTVTSAPELLARHYAAANRHERAVHFWQRASEAALSRLALPEAIAALRAGLVSAERLPAGRERDLAILALRTMLGPALLAHRGWAHSEASTVLEPAWRLAESHTRSDSYLPILHGLWVHHMSGGRLSVSVEWAARMLERAEQGADESLAIAGRRAMMTSLFWQGELVDARLHGDVIVDRYDPERHGQIAARTHSDPLTGDGIYRAHYLWMLGFPDQARVVAENTIAHARQRAHPFDVAFALTLGAQVFEYCGDAARLLQCADDAERIGREYGVPLMSEIMAEISKGEGWLLQGRTADGTAQLREAIGRLNATGHRIWLGYLQSRLGEAMAREGAQSEGLALVRASRNTEDFLEDRVHLAEILRLGASILLMQGNVDLAVSQLHESLAVARAQSAKSWELRTATTLASAYVRMGDPVQARELLGPILDWFTEGFDTTDVRAARVLCDSITH